MVRVAQNLTQIVHLAEHLLTQAVHSANDREIPGGDALVGLGPVADPQEYIELIDAAEFHHYADPLRWGENTIDLEHESQSDDELGAILWTLWYWSSQWRDERGYPLEGRQATLTTEAGFLRGCLDWAWDEINAIEWQDFADDMAGTRQRLENILRAGDRSQRGAPCMYDECGGVALYRKAKPARGGDGEKTWVLSDWICPRCKRTWDEGGYARNVRAATEGTKREQIGRELWCTDDVAAQMVGRSVKTIRTWADRGEIGWACLLAGQRKGFVLLADVRDKHALSKRRRTA